MSFLLSVLIVGFIVFIHEFGHFLAARICRVPVASFALGFGPPLVTWKWCGTEFKINLIPFGGYIEIARTSSQEDPLSSAPLVAQTFIASAGILMNLILGFVLLVSIPLIGGSMSAGDGTGVYVAEVIPHSAAAQAGIQKDDVIVRVKDEKSSVSRKVLSNQELVAFTKITRSDPLECTVRRGMKYFSYTLTPQHVTIGGVSKYTIGIYLNAMAVEKESLPSSLEDGSKNTVGILKLIVISLPKEVVHITSTGDASRMSGPVGIVTAGSVAVHSGILSVMFLMAEISLGLVVLNVLPFPMLDGWLLFKIAIKAVSGRELPRSANTVATYAGLLLLLTFALMVTGSDILKLLD